MTVEGVDDRAYVLINQLYACANISFSPISSEDSDFSEVQKSMSTVNISSSEQKEIFRVCVFVPLRKVTNSVNRFFLVFFGWATFVSKVAHPLKL